MAREATQRLDELTVAQLRQMAREQGIKRYSRLKKAELIKALDRADTAAQTEDETDRAADTRATADHDEIRAWADERNAVPATEEGAGEAARPVVLRFRFPGSPAANLEQIDWPTWFRAFDHVRLRFIYAVPSDGSRSNSFQLERQ
jgi:Rho termination factor, N-terminal domain